MKEYFVSFHFVNKDQEPGFGNAIVSIKKSIDSRLGLEEAKKEIISGEEEITDLVILYYRRI